MHDAAIVRLSEMGVPLQMYSGVILTYLVSAAAVHRPEMDTVLITISPGGARSVSQVRT